MPHGPESLCQKTAASMLSAHNDGQGNLHCGDKADEGYIPRTMVSVGDAKARHDRKTAPDQGCKKTAKFL